MQAERMRVLELIQNGTITIEQGNELIDALHAANQPKYQTSGAEFKIPEPPKPPRAPRASGGGKFSFEQMIELGKFGINAQYVRELAEAGFNNLSFDDIVKFGKFGIRPEYVIELQQIAEEFELDELDSEKIIELGKFGVRPENVREMLESGLFDLSQTKPVLSPEQIQAQRDQLQTKLDKMQAKRDKVLAKLEAAKTDEERIEYALAHHENEISLQNLNEQMDSLVRQEIDHEDEV